MKNDKRTNTCKTDPPASSTFLWNCKKNQNASSTFLWNGKKYNCKNEDLWCGAGIMTGRIVLGTQGFVAAECGVPKKTGILVAFQPNRRCLWKINGLEPEVELDCMAKPGAPKGKAEGQGSHGYNYIVAQIPDAVMRKMPQKYIDLVVRTPDGNFVNLEIARFGKHQDRKRFAELL
jgi:hypothetical protein